MPFGRTSAVTSRWWPANAISTSKLLMTNRRPLTANVSLMSVPPTNARRLPARRLHFVSAFLMRRLLVAFGRTRCSCTTDGGSPNHLPVALPPPPPRPACLPDFMATATQSRSRTFLIRAGLLVGTLPDGYHKLNPLPQVPTKQSVLTSKVHLPPYFRLPIGIPTLCKDRWTYNS
jgi:hypothetical protein